MSTSNYPTLTATVPIYNWLIDNLEDSQDKQEKYNDLKEAIQKAINKLKEYYQMTDSSVYPIATSKYKFLILNTVFKILLIYFFSKF